MDWFERLTGFPEASYDATRQRLGTRDGHLLGRDGKAWSMGQLSMPSLAELRLQAAPLLKQGTRTRVSCMAADVRALHAQPEARGALFQVASQFNLLEMVGPEVTPEHGVTRYQHDHTQGPACAIAAGAGTVYRNYLVPLGEQTGQRAGHQIDTLADLGRALAVNGQAPWRMSNGYALCTAQELAQIGQRLQAAGDAALDELRGQLRIGLHRDVDVTDLDTPGHRVSQAYCSALPVAYSGLPAAPWARFATLVLEAAYEATLLAAVLQREATGCGRVYLTSLGGGAFGNDPAWITAAMQRAIHLSLSAGLDVRLVSYRSIPPELAALARTFA